MTRLMVSKDNMICSKCGREFVKGDDVWRTAKGSAANKPFFSLTEDDFKDVKHKKCPNEV